MKSAPASCSPLRTACTALGILVLSIVTAAMVVVMLVRARDTSQRCAMTGLSCSRLDISSAATPASLQPYPDRQFQADLRTTFYVLRFLLDSDPAQLITSTNSPV